jgi:hypothetical protein
MPTSPKKRIFINPFDWLCLSIILEGRLVFITSSTKSTEEVPLLHKKVGS